MCSVGEISLVAKSRCHGNRICTPFKLATVLSTNPTNQMMYLGIKTGGDIVCSQHCGMEEDDEVKVTNLHFLWQLNGRLSSSDQEREWLKCSLCFSPPLNPWRAERTQRSMFYAVPPADICII